MWICKMKFRIENCYWFVLLQTISLSVLSSIRAMLRYLVLEIYWYYFWFVHGIALIGYTHSFGLLLLLNKMKIIQISVLFLSISGDFTKDEKETIHFHFFSPILFISFQVYIFQFKNEMNSN